MNEHHKKNLYHPKYRPDIDGLRAIAVMSVVVFHAFPKLMPGGFIGVDIFFIISGYLISTIIYRNLESNTFSFKEFYARRIKRIFPALILVLISCYSFGWFTLFADEFQQLGKHTSGGAGFISNLVLLDESGYFDTTSDIKPLLHLWSLGIEEQFYIFWPFILWAVWKARINTFAATLTLLAVSFAFNMYNVDSHPTETFYLLHMRAWELLSGSILAYLSIHGLLRNISTFTRNVMSISGVTIIAYGMHSVTSHGFPGWQAIIPCMGAILIIAAGKRAWINGFLLSSKPFVWVGLISFPLYLWHWPLLTFPRIINSGSVSFEIRSIAVLLSFILAAITYHFVEKPIRSFNWRFKTGALCLTMITVGYVGYYTYSNAGLPKRSSIVEAEKINAQMVSTTGWAYAKNDICLKRYPFSDAIKYEWWFCMTNRDAPPSIVLLGNSFANHLYPGMAKAIPKETILSIGACDPTFGIMPENPVNPCSGRRPLNQSNFINSIIKKSSSVKLIVIDGLCQFPINGNCFFEGKEYIDRLKERIATFNKMGIKVVVFVPHLTINYNIKSCFGRPLKSPNKSCYISKDEHVKHFKYFISEMSKITSSMKNVYIYDQNETFCNSKGCSMIIDGMPAFRDEFYHYSEYASEKVGENFKNWMIREKINI